MNADIAVVGLGATGSMALWRLASRGVKVAGFERHGIGHDRGSTHGETRAFFHIDPEKAAYVPLTERAAELWSELSEASSVQLKVDVGGLFVGAEKSELITDLDALIAQEEYAHERLSCDEIRTRFPAHRVSEGDVGIFDPLTAYLKPELAVRAAVGEAVKTGNAEVYSHAGVSRIEPHAAGVTVHVGEERYEFDRVIVAAGAWTGSLMPEYRLPLEVRRIPMTWFTASPGREEWFTPERFPVFFRDIGDQMGWGFPTLSSIGTKIGLDGRYGEVLEDPSVNRDRAIEADKLDSIQRFVQGAFDGIDPHPTTVHPCMVTWAGKEDFIIGPMEENPRVVLLSACSGRGMKHSPATGELAVQHALNEVPFTDVSMFTPRVARA
ncbi:FAD-dependent oxidoreductase [Leucobacter alluvii]|uniref:FAD-dependent oxidoreductase n=1 Tax=Leucobacter alluvii TaxID=340321 RepID=A0ABN3B4Q9_9MICO